RLICVPKCEALSWTLSMSDRDLVVHDQGRTRAVSTGLWVDKCKGESGMGQSQRKGLPTWLPWAATVAVTALVVIIIAGAVEGFRLRVQVEESKTPATDVPNRNTVYPVTVSVSPTVVGTPHEAGAVDVPEVPLATVLTATDLRSGPGTRYAAVRRLLVGEEVQVLVPTLELEGQQWQRVKTAKDAQLGWCLRGQLKLMSATE
ncbi:MAG: SH3 domain-containing protein, partial [Anaerolineae bacterium]